VANCITVHTTIIIAEKLIEGGFVWGEREQDARSRKVVRKVALGGAEDTGRQVAPPVAGSVLAGNRFEMSPNQSNLHFSHLIHSLSFKIIIFMVKYNKNRLLRVKSY